MSDAFGFRITGRPTPWKRAGRNGKRTYSTQTKVKDDIGYLAKQAMSNQGFKYCKKGVAVELVISAGFALPKTLRKGDARKVGDYHTQKPDGDNIGKLIKDALTGVVWRDDCQVAIIQVDKSWYKTGFTDVYIERLK